jgi:hypothetical protein
MYENLKVGPVDWTKVSHFPEIQSRHDAKGVVPEILYCLNSFRDALGFPITVSPNPNAIVSSIGHLDHSQHPLGRAIDVFCSCTPNDVTNALKKYNPFTGIGFYFDTHINGKEHFMMHFDVRVVGTPTTKFYWMRDAKKYHGDGYFNLGRDAHGKIADFYAELDKNVVAYMARITPAAK